jgi:carbon storage regulator
MLVLGRGVGEGITIRVDGRVIHMTVVGMRGNRVRLGFEADKDVEIDRDEVLAQKLAGGGPAA